MKPGHAKRPCRSMTSVPFPASRRSSWLEPISSTVEPRTAIASTRGLPGSPVQMRPFSSTRSARPVFVGPLAPARSVATAANNASATSAAA